jgi:hypothetical protein
LNLRPHEAQLEDQKQKKAQEGHLEERKNAKPIDGMKSGKPRKGKENLKRKTPLKQTPLTLSMQALPLRYNLSCFFSQQPG